MQGMLGAHRGIAQPSHCPMSFLFLAQNFQGRGEQKEWNGNDQKKERRVR